MDGVAKTSLGSNIIFREDQVLWVRGIKIPWPDFVYAAFRGELEDFIVARDKKRELERQKEEDRQIAITFHQNVYGCSRIT